MPCNRRSFLCGLAGAPALLSLAPSIPCLLARSATSVPGGLDHERILVAVQLTGGNDGLNTVVPFENEIYARARPTLRLKAAEVHKLDHELGLHPQMAAMARLYAEGSLTILQGVGCDGLSRNHEEALQVWQTGASDPTHMQTGWLGRAADHLWEIEPFQAPAAFVGNIARPLGINSAVTVTPTIRQLDDVLDVNDSGATATTGAGVFQTSPTNPSSLLRHVWASQEAAQEQAQRLAYLGSQQGVATAYPNCSLGRDLRTVAELIRADTGIRIFYTELGGGGIGGFDNHANQRGNHGALLGQLAESLAAFVDDLRQHGLLERVMVMTFSEFGRTVAENGRRGTDHGAAGPMFFLGGGVRGGIHNAHPSLSDLDAGALRHQTDYRAVYGTVLTEWLGIPRRDVLVGDFGEVRNLIMRV